MLKQQPVVLPTVGKLLLKLLLTARRKAPQQEWTDYPSLGFIFQSVYLDKQQLKKYKQLFPRLLAEVPLSYFYLMAQRAQLFVCSNQAFPYPVLGMVHCNNRLQQFSSVNTSLPLDIQVRIEDIKVDSRHHSRVFFKVNFSQDKLTVIECVSEYLIKGKRKKERQNTALRRNKNPQPVNLNSLECLQLSADMGRKYARVSGDYNPIHLYPWLAKMFGFKRPIIHGMYSAAYAQQVIEQHTGQALKCMDVAFKRPVLLPTEVEFNSVTDQPEQQTFLLTSSQQSVVHMRVECA